MADVNFDDLIPKGKGQQSSTGDVSFDDLIPKQQDKSFWAGSYTPVVHGAVRGLASIPGLPGDIAASALGHGEDLVDHPENIATTPAALPSVFMGLASKAGRGISDLVFNGKSQPPKFGDVTNGIMQSTRDLGVIPSDPNYTPSSTGGKFVDNLISTVPQLLVNPAGATAGGIGGAVRAIAPLVGGAAGQTAAEEIAPNNPIASGLATLAGGVGGGLAANSNQIAKGLIRGGTSAAEVQQNIDDFSKVGATPTVAQAIQKPAAPGGNPQPNFVAQGIETAASNYPGGAGVMGKKAADLQQGVGTTMGKMADDLAPGSDPITAGRAIQKGVAEGFTPDKRAQEGKLWDEYFNAIPSNTRVKVNPFVDALEEMAGGSTQAKNTRAAIGGDVDQRLNDILVAVRKDMGEDGSLSIGAIKDIRTRLGKKIDGMSGPSADAELRGAYKNLYGKLTDSLEAGSMDYGDGAAQAFSRATGYSRALNERLGLLNDVTKSDIPERIFQTATGNTKDGATVLAATMKSIPQDQRKEVASAVLRRMGLAKAGQQNASGDAFSMETFLTNWNSMSPQAKNALFNGLGNSELRSNIDAISRVAGNVRVGGKVFSNPSGTARQTALIGLLGGSGIGGLASGNVPLAAGAAATVAGANITARMMTNPAAVRWLAKSAPQYGTNNLNAAVRNMMQAANASGDAEFKSIAKELNDKQNSATPGNNQSGSVKGLEKVTQNWEKNTVIPYYNGAQANSGTPANFDVNSHIMDSEGASGIQDGRNEIFGFRAGEGTGYDQLRRMELAKGKNSPEVRALASSLLTARAARAGVDRFENPGVKAAVATSAQLRGEGGARAIMAMAAGIPVNSKGLAQLPSAAVDKINSMSPEEFQTAFRQARENYDRRFLWNNPATVVVNGKTKSGTWGNLFGKGVLSRYDEEANRFRQLNNT